MIKNRSKYFHSIHHILVPILNICVHLILTAFYEGNHNSILILQERRLRHREVDYLAKVTKLVG